MIGDMIVIEGGNEGGINKISIISNKEREREKERERGEVIRLSLTNVYH